MEDIPVLTPEKIITTIKNKKTGEENIIVPYEDFALISSYLVVTAACENDLESFGISTFLSILVSLVFVSVVISIFSFMLISSPILQFYYTTQG